MLKREPMFFTAFIILGVADWLTTASGILFFGATEANPLLSGLTTSSMLVFSIIKLSAVAVIGFTFYLATAISKSGSAGRLFQKKFLYGAYLLTVSALSIVVANNVLSLLGI